MIDDVIIKFQENVSVVFQKIFFCKKSQKNCRCCWNDFNVTILSLL